MWDWGAFLHYLHSPYLLKGAGVSLALSVAAMAVGLVLGLLAAMMRMSPSRLVAAPAAFYVWIMRGTPALVQLIIIYTGLPQLGITLGVIPSAVLGLGLNEGAYLSEIFRAGIAAVPHGQFEAARALGLSRFQLMRLVVLPQAMRIIVPPLGNAFNGLMKTSSLASVISMEELLRRTELLIQVQFKVLEIFVDAAIFYLALTTIWGFIQRRIERHYGRGYAPSSSAPQPAPLALEQVALQQGTS